MYRILIDGQCVYACTDWIRFVREASKFASVSNATFAKPGE